MDLLSDELKSYLESSCDPESDLLKQIDRETNLKVSLPRMLSGHYQGRVLSLLSKLLNPQRILEVGTFTGYASLCLAEGLSKDGILHTIDINAELEDMVRNSFSKSDLGSKIIYHIGDALKIITNMVDNVLWSGKVIGEKKTDSATTLISDFNKMICSDQRVEKLILPVRDGLYIIRKK